MRPGATRLFVALLGSLTVLSLLLSFNFNQIHFRHERPPKSSNANQGGQWGPPISLSLVPVAIAVLPLSGKVLAWSADKRNVFSSDVTHTHSAIYDPSTHDVVDHDVSVTHHNMFCPGLSMDSSGRVVVTGGSASTQTSIFDDAQSRWLSGPPLTLGRGYHAQATLSTGDIFTIGGSWSGPISPDKNGELLSISNNTWIPLPSALASPILTNDAQGDFAADNHAWLFAWKSDSVFHAGPSSAMNWYGTSPYTSGSHYPAGLRANDADSMNGNAVMYDALNGKILTLGGAPSYTNSSATAAAHIVTLPSTPFSIPSVEEIQPMHFPRAYANSVILPTGDVLIVGGTTYARQWTDANATLIPELWSHKTKTFTKMAQMDVPRTYHSVAVLLPDGTVLTGGGGLCWEECVGGTREEVNHMNLQRYLPGYLFTGDGDTLARRPRVLGVSNTHVVVGGELVVTTDVEVGEFALLRYGTATHAVNTDQRRVSIEAVGVEGEGKVYKLNVPDDAGVVIPGYWMLFAISGEGVPSVSERLLIKGEE
ncbi:hypothetical protein QBC44DRAFT_248232 [Cladorrhinum sp. PSN332]|nr:hypothetical protein QBC44DRAFT_248232 [Cladorrhinum sp. PSN332]